MYFLLFLCVNNRSQWLNKWNNITYRRISGRRIATQSVEFPTSTGSSWAVLNYLDSQNRENKTKTILQNRNFFLCAWWWSITIIQSDCVAQIFICKWNPIDVLSFLIREKNLFKLSYKIYMLKVFSKYYFLKVFMCLSLCNLIQSSWYSRCSYYNIVCKGIQKAYQLTKKHGENFK